MHLSALTLIVPDYDDAISYYCDTMGFVLEQDIDQGDKRWVRVVPNKGAQTGFILACGSTAEQVEAIGNQGAGRVWLFLETDDFATDHARLAAAGVQFAESPRVEVYGTVVVFTDKYGNRWDLIQYT